MRRDGRYVAGVSLDNREAVVGLAEEAQKRVCREYEKNSREGISLRRAYAWATEALVVRGSLDPDPCQGMRCQGEVLRGRWNLVEVKGGVGHFL